MSSNNVSQKYSTIRQVILVCFFSLVRILSSIGGINRFGHFLNQKSTVVFLSFVIGTGGIMLFVFFMTVYWALFFLLNIVFIKLKNWWVALGKKLFWDIFLFSLVFLLVFLSKNISKINILSYLLLKVSGLQG